MEGWAPEPKPGLRSGTCGSQGRGPARPRSGPAPGVHSDIAQAGKPGAGSSQSLETHAWSPIAPFSFDYLIVRPEPLRHEKEKNPSDKPHLIRLGDASLGASTWSRRRPGDPGARPDSFGMRGSRSNAPPGGHRTEPCSAGTPETPRPARRTLRRLGQVGQKQADTCGQGHFVLVLFGALTPENKNA